MDFQAIGTAADMQLRNAARKIEHYARFEGFVALVCALTPFLLMAAEPGPTRDSISAYWNVGDARVFYVPLSVAAMLFIVNGLVKKEHPYNVVLGAALMGVVLCNQVDWPTIHRLFAVVFFVGNAVVIVKYTPRDELWIKLALVAVIVISLAGWLIFGLISLFWAESISLWIIALHYTLEAWEAIH